MVEYTPCHVLGWERRCPVLELTPACTKLAPPTGVETFASAVIGAGCGADLGGISSAIKALTHPHPNSDFQKILRRTSTVPPFVELKNIV